MRGSISLTPTSLTRAIIWMLALSLAGTSAAQTTATKPAGLRIVVIAGEDAVNVIEQKTAVAPIVEVRDRNDQPVAGAVVRFAIQGGKATFSGARTLSVTTNVAGRAAVTGFTPTASGAVQISASAAFQGQTAVVAITQTNVLTIAEAAAATSAGASSGGTAAGTGAAAGGGGLPFTTIGLLGGVAAAGAVVTTKVLGGGTSYKGAFSGPMVLTFPSSTITCTRTELFTGTVEMDLDVSGDVVTGTALVDGKTSVTGFGPSPLCLGTIGPTGNIQSDTTRVSGNSANLSFKHDEMWTSPATTNDPGGSSNTLSVAFSGALNAGAINGTLTITSRTVPTNPSLVPGGALGGNAFGGSGSASYPMTLR